MFKKSSHDNDDDDDNNDDDVDEGSWSVAADFQLWIVACKPHPSAITSTTIGCVG